MRAFLIAAALLLAVAPSASAGGANGLLVSNVDFNCFSLATGSPYVEPMISGIVGWGSEKEFPVTGEPFSASVSVGLVGRSCSGAEISPTVIPPVGVRIAVDKDHPLQWKYPDSDWQTSGAKLLPLADGSAKIVAEASGTQLWPIANDQPPLQFLIPLVAERELRGAGSPPGACPDGPPCAPGEAGDYLQVRIDTSIGTPLVLAPVVALYATEGAATKLTVPAKVRAATLSKGLGVKVAAAKGAKLKLVLKAGRTVVARGSATAKADGTTTVKVKAVRRVKAGKATLTLTASGAGLTAVTKTAALRITA
jgi:hypothetical protein